MNWLYSPLQSYIKTSLSKYFSNVDLQNFGILSGDIVLRDLEFRLDALQEALSIPLSFVFSRGFIKELRIQIPWAHLFSRPIEVKISTIECILTARSGLQFKKLQLAYESKRSNSVDALREPDATEDTEAGPASAGAGNGGTGVDAGKSEGSSESWLQDSFSAVLANASIEISNLVLKYEHANVVMSTSVRSIHIFSADPHDRWAPKYQVLQDRFRMLHKACTLDGLTICLDRLQKDRSRTISFDTNNPNSSPGNAASPNLKNSPAPTPSPFRRPRVTLFEVPILKRATVTIRGRFAMRLTSAAGVQPVSEPAAGMASSSPLSSSSATTPKASPYSSANKSTSLLPTRHLDIHTDPFSDCECMHELQPSATSSTSNKVVVLAVEVECDNMHFSVSERQFIMLRDLGVLPDEDSDADTVEETPEPPAPPPPEPARPAGQGWGSWAWGVVTGGGEEARVDEVEQEMLRSATETLQASTAASSAAVPEPKTVQIVSLVACRIASASVSFLVRPETNPSTPATSHRPSPSRFSFDSPDLASSGRRSAGHKAGKEKVEEMLTVEIVGTVMELRSEAFTKTIRVDVRHINATQPSLPTSGSSRAASRPAVLSIGAPADQLCLLPHPADCWSWSLDSSMHAEAVDRADCCYAVRSAGQIKRSSISAIRACIRLEREEEAGGSGEIPGRLPDAIDVAVGPARLSLDTQLVDGLRTFFGVGIDAHEEDGRQGKESAAMALKELAAEYKRLVQKRQSQRELLFELLLTAPSIDIEISTSASSASSTSSHQDMFPSAHFSFTNLAAYTHRVCPSDEQKDLGGELVCPSHSFRIPTTPSLMDASVVFSLTSCTLHVGVDKAMRRKEKVLGVRGLAVSLDLRHNPSVAFEGRFGTKLAQIETAFSLRQVGICLAVLQRLRGRPLLAETTEELPLSETLMAVRMEARDAAIQSHVLGTGTDADLGASARLGLFSVRTIGGQSGYAVLAPFGPPASGHLTVDVDLHLVAPPIGMLLHFMPIERFWRTYCPPRLLTSTKAPEFSFHLHSAPAKVMWPALISIMDWMPKARRKIQAGLALDKPRRGEQEDGERSVNEELGFGLMESLFNDRWRLQLRLSTAGPTVVFSPQLTAKLPQVEMNTAAGEAIAGASHVLTMKLFGAKVGLRDTMAGLDKLDLSLRLSLSFDHQDGVVRMKRAFKAEVSPVSLVIDSRLVQALIKIPGMPRGASGSEKSRQKSRFGTSGQRQIECFDSVEVQLSSVSVSFLPEKTARIRQLDGTIFHQPALVRAQLQTVAVELRKDPAEKAMSLSVLDFQCYESMDDQAVVVSGRIKGSGFTFAVWLTVLSHLSTSDIGSLVTAFGLPLVPADAIRAHVVEQLIADNTVYWMRAKEHVAQELVKASRQAGMRGPDADRAAMCPLFCSDKSRKQHMLVSLLAKDTPTSSFLHLTSQSAQIVARNATCLSLLSLLAPLTSRASPSTTGPPARQSQHSSPKHFRVILNTRPVTFFLPASQPLPLLRPPAATVVAARFLRLKLGSAAVDVDSRPREMKEEQVVQLPSMQLDVGHFEASNSEDGGVVEAFIAEAGNVSGKVRFMAQTTVMRTNMEGRCKWQSEGRPVLKLSLEQVAVHVTDRRTWELLVNAFDLLSLSGPLFWHLLRDSFLDPDLMPVLSLHPSMDMPIRSTPSESVKHRKRPDRYHGVGFDLSLGEFTLDCGEVVHIEASRIYCSGDSIEGKASVGNVRVDGVNGTTLFKVDRIPDKGIEESVADVWLRWRTDVDNGDREVITELGGEARSWLPEEAVSRVIHFLDAQYPRLQLPTTTQAAKEMVVIRRKLRAKKMASMAHELKMKMVVPQTHTTFLTQDASCLVAATREVFFATSTQHVQKSDGIFVRMELFVGTSPDDLEEWVPECTVKMSSELGLAPYTFGVNMDMSSIRFRITPESNKVLHAVGQRMILPMYRFYYMSYVTGSTPRLDGLSALQAENTEGEWEDLSKRECLQGVATGVVTSLKDVWRVECCDMLQEAEVLVHTSPRRPTPVHTARTLTWTYPVASIVKEVSYAAKLHVPWLGLEFPIGLNVGLSCWDDLRDCYVLVHAFVVTLASAAQMDTTQDSTTVAFADAFNSMVDATLGATPVSSSKPPTAEARRKIAVSDLARIEASTQWSLHWTAASSTKDPRDAGLSDEVVNDLLREAVSIRASHCDSYIPVFHVSMEAESVRAGLITGRHGHEIVSLEAKGLSYIYRKRKTKGAATANTVHRLASTLSVSCQNFTNLSKAHVIPPAQLRVIAHVDPDGARAIDFSSQAVHVNVEHALVLTLHQALEAIKAPVKDRPTVTAGPDRDLRIVVHNHTGSRLFLGQHATSESISVGVGGRTAYSWRVPSASPSMRFALGESEAGTWSRPLALDAYGVFSRVLYLEERQLQVFVVVQGGNNGLQTLVQVQAGFKVINFSALPVSIELAHSRHLLPACRSSPVEIISQGVGKPTPVPAPAAVKEAPMGLLADERIHLHAWAEHAAVNLCAEEEEASEVRVSLQLEGASSWSASTVLTADKPALVELPGDGPAQPSAWLWVTFHPVKLRRLHHAGATLTPGEAFATAWAAVELWPLAYILNATSRTLSVKLRPEKRWESLEFAMQQRPEDQPFERGETTVTTNTTTWPAVFQSQEGQSGPGPIQSGRSEETGDTSATIRGDEETKTLLRDKYASRRPSERRQSREDARAEEGRQEVALVQSSQRMQLQLNPAKSHILFLSDEQAVTWSDPGLRLEPPVLRQSAREMVEKFSEEPGASRMLHERQVSFGTSSVVVQASTLPSTPVLALEVKPRVMLKNESNQRVWVHCLSDQVECCSGASEALPFANVLRSGICLSLDGDTDGSTKTKALRLDEVDTQFVALPVPQADDGGSSLQVETASGSGSWLIILSCVIQRQQPSSTVTIILRNRVLLHNKTGLPNLRIQIVSGMDRQDHFQWDPHRVLAPLSFYHDLADADDDLPKEGPSNAPQVQRSASGMFGFLWNSAEPSAASPKQPSGVKDTCPETSKPELRTGFALCVAEEEGEVVWSNQILIPSLIKQEKLLWQRLLVPNVDQGRAELFGCSMCEEGSTVHVAVYHDKQPAFVIRSELEQETLYFKLGNAARAQLPQRVLRIPPLSIVAFDPAMLGMKSASSSTSSSSSNGPARLRRQSSVPMLEVDRADSDFSAFQTLQSKVFEKSEAVTFKLGQCHSEAAEPANLPAKDFPGLCADEGQIKWSRPVLQTVGRCTLPLQGPQENTTLMQLRIAEAQGCYVMRVAEHDKSAAQEEDAKAADRPAMLRQQMKVRVCVEALSFAVFEDGQELFQGCFNEVAGMVFHAKQVRQGGLQTTAQACSRQQVTLTKEAFILSAAACQLSSFLEDAEFPIILDVKAAQGPSLPGAKVALKTVKCGAHFTPFAEAVHVELAPCFVVVEDVVIARGVALATKLLAQLNAQQQTFMQEKSYSREANDSGRYATAELASGERRDSEFEELMVFEGAGAGEGRGESAKQFAVMPEELGRIEKQYVYIGALHVSKLQFELTLRNVSMPMFVGIDDTLVRFTQLDVAHIFAAREVLMKELLANYLADALLNSPALIGSLEIIGNPTGFIRAISSGMWDLIAMPMEEMQHGFGPGALLRGVAKGWLSWFKHVSRGALSSVSGFSHSVARNLDKLSLDQDYINRRRRLNIWTNKWANNRHGRGRSNALARGITHGLVGFSQGVLGAATGMISLPLATAQTDDWRLRSVVAGIGKGLAGVVLKPASGAADLVAQTSDGIMNQAGLGSIHKHLPLRTEPTLLEWTLNAVLRIDWKMLPDGEHCARFAHAVWMQGASSSPSPADSLGDRPEAEKDGQAEAKVEVVLTARYFRVYVVGDAGRSHEDLCLQTSIPWNFVVLHESISTDCDLKVESLSDNTEDTSLESVNDEQLTRDDGQEHPAPSPMIHLRFNSRSDRKEISKYASHRCRYRTSY